MMAVLQGILLISFETLGCFLFFDIFTDKRTENKWQNLALFFLLVFIFLIFSFASFGVFYIKATIVLISIIIVMSIYYKSSLMQIAFLSFGFYALLITIDYIIVIILDQLIEENIWENPIRSMVYAILGKMVMLFSIFLFSRKFKKKSGLNLITNTEWIRFLLFPIITIISMIWFLIDRADNNSVLFVSFSLVIANFLVYFIISDIVKREKNILEARVSEERTRNRVTMYQAMTENFHEQRKKVHEHKNQTMCIKELLEKKEHDKAVEYVNSICNSHIDEMNYVNTNHPIINAVINQKYKLAKLKGIAMVLSLNDLSSIRIKDEDLVIILANLLDNAIEACEKVKEAEKIIKFRLISHGNEISLSVKNPTIEKLKIINNYPISTKQNPDEHGIGMQNIETAVKKYNGECNYSNNDGFFTYAIVIK